MNLVSYEQKNHRISLEKSLTNYSFLKKAWKPFFLKVLLSSNLIAISLRAMRQPSLITEFSRSEITKYEQFYLILLSNF